MTPEEIESVEFFVAMRGYERDEVRSFLRSTAAEHRRLLERLDAAERGSDGGALEDLLSEQVRAIVRAARTSASALLEDAEQRAAEVRTAAEAEGARRAEELVERARTEAEALVAAASARHADLTAAADRLAAQLEEANGGVQAALRAMRPGLLPSLVEAPPQPVEPPAEWRPAPELGFAP